MTTGDRAAVRIGAQDEDLQDRLDKELTDFNHRATGAYDEQELSVRVTDDRGELVGGLTGSTWGGLCSVDMLWVREDARHAGWGRTLMRAAEEEALRRGCEGVAVSSFTFQAPDFYRGLGYAETGRTPGIPGGNEDVHLFKRLTWRARRQPLLPRHVGAVPGREDRTHVDGARDTANHHARSGTEARRGARGTAGADA
ncbi:GNAT family N-acetyltransferase [Streptomyces candidus]|uniref:Ribosomal protein S18 acetylase RimI-like enzyme n=1 Tax=Streptomyces candidus TaxID=67283 RepID=A0A7X0HD20_9ACTN|nr:GNAT family N-acetyltransferase [Streptomyces candidus]MBB6434032.1 ribosomal protein S18 acetylase RimI-like enzyme [Streptomyces candidus]